MENHPIVLEKIFDVPLTKVWNSITNNNEMKKWYFNLGEFKPVIGFKFKFSGGPTPEKQYLHLCEITELIHEKKIIYSWLYSGYEGISYVSFELSSKNNQTLLTLTHTGIETFPKNNSDFAIENFIKGWNEIISTSLKNYLEN